MVWLGCGPGPDADDLGHDPRDLGRGVELALALARLGGEVAHQVLVGIAQDVVAFGAVAAEIQGGVLKIATRLDRRSTISLPRPSLSGR
jgi:hypothetical protein